MNEPRVFNPEEVRVTYEEAEQKGHLRGVRESSVLPRDEPPSFE